MFLLVFIIAISLFVFGAVFALAFVGGFPGSHKSEFETVNVFGKKLAVEHLTIGVTLLLFGILWLSAWIYFLFSRWDSFIQQFNFLFAHVAIQFLTSLALLCAGTGILLQWRRWRGFYLSAIAMLAISVLVSVTLYGQTGHGVPMLMYLFSVLTLAIAGVLTVELYVLKRFLSGNWNISDKTPLST